MAEDSMTVGELTGHVGIKPEALEQKFSEGHLSKFSKSIANWEQYAKPLGLSDQQIMEIRTDPNLDQGMKALKMLEKWKKKNAFKATYRRMVTVCLEQEDAELAEEVCKLLKVSGSEVESSKEHSKPLSEEVLKEALVLAEKEHSEHTPIPKSGDTPSKPKAKEPLFCKDTVYHADICCRILAEGDAGNYQSLFKKLLNGQGHSFKAVSMSRSKTERLLIAEQGDSLIYFAFESLPQLCDWKDYKSFDEGITKQSQHFPIRYIVELLNKQHRIVLTGFSFGGLLANCVAAMVWNLPYISADLLKDNLTCITFGKPLVSVRIILSVAQRRPEISSTIHSIQMESDHVPSLLRFLDVSWSAKELAESEGGSSGAVALSMPLQDPVTSSMMSSLQKIQSNRSDSKEALLTLRSKLCELQSKLPQLPDLPESFYKIMCDPELGLLFKCLINAKAKEHFANSPDKLDEGIFKVHIATEYSANVFLSHLDRDPKYSIPQAPKHAPQELQNLLPSIKEVHIHHHGDQTAIVLEGTNLWFCSELSLLGHKQRIPASSISGNSIKFNRKKQKDNEESKQLTQAIVYTQFSSKPVKQEVPLYVKGYAVTTRQEQLAKLSPSQVIELAYLSALLEQTPSGSSAHTVNSHKVEVIAAFLKDVVQVVPFESIAYAITYSSYKTALKCYEALIECGIKPPCTIVMNIGLRLAGNRMAHGIPPLELLDHDRNTRESTGTLSHSTISYLDSSASAVMESVPDFTSVSLPGYTSTISTLSHKQVYKERNAKIGLKIWTMHTQGYQVIEACEFQVPSVSDLNIDRLYPASSAQAKTFKPPIDILINGKEELSQLASYAVDSGIQSKTTDYNKRMLDMLNGIRRDDLEVCTSLLGGFMEQQVVDILLVNPLSQDKTQSLHLGAAASVGVWVLFSLDLEHTQPILSQCNSEKLLVKVIDYVESMAGITDTVAEDTNEGSSYAAKLQFMVEGMAKTVTCNTQYVSYSLERQLVELCKDIKIDASVSLQDLQNKWGALFKGKTLYLVDQLCRPLIGRWLKWALMVHNLREELARYTAIGVTGLVNSGKSKLINTLFGIKVPIDTTEGSRTTVPFLYNLDESVEGLNVVDFPGVDNEDDTIGDLADLLITVAQIILFVVDYRKAHTQSAKKWLERLHKEKVPVLVCLTFGDKLYAEQMTAKGVHPTIEAMSAIVSDQLAVTEAKLRPTGSHKVSFLSFAQDNDSVLNSDKGRSKLRDVGIGSPLQVGEWLVEVFKRDFDNEQLANQLEPFMSKNAAQ